MLRINFLGDSITKGERATSPEKGFVSLVGKNLPAEVRNYGISGTRFAIQKTPSSKPEYDRYFASRIDEMNHDADYIFVFGGTNDFGHGDAPIGRFGDKTPDTFFGAVDFLANELLKHYKKEQIIFIEPLYRTDEIVPCNHIKPFKHTMPEYREDLRAVLQKYDIEILDLKDKFGKAENSPLYFDHVHPNDEGHKKLAELIVEYIRSRQNGTSNWRRRYSNQRFWVSW